VVAAALLVLGGLAVSQLAGQVRAVGAAKIFVPQPKGAGDTLDDTAGKDAGSGDKIDVVVTLQGDRLLGNVLSMEAGGKLKLSGTQYEGEVTVLANAVDLLSLRGSDKQSGGDELVLTNGDRLIGSIVGITPEGVLLDTDAAGRLKVALKVIRTLNMNKPENILLESSFGSGRMDPWASRAGGMWNIVDNVLVCNNRGSNMGPLYAKLDQKEAVTMIAKVQAMDGNGLALDMVLFSDANDGSSDEGRYGRNSLIARFNNSEAYLQYTVNGSNNHIANRSFNRSVQGGILRLAYDPATNKAQLWLDNAFLGENPVPNRLQQGRFVMINSYYPAKIEWVKVARGIVPPTGDEDLGGPAKGETGTIVQFTNKDRVSVSALSMADGEMVLSTSFGSGPIKCSAKSVARIMFAEKGIEEPRRQPGDVRVSASVGRITVKFDRLTDSELVGHSDYLGDIKVQRSAIREVKFNLYK
jgi:hypothetical protein